MLAFYILVNPVKHQIPFNVVQSEIVGKDLICLFLPQTVSGDVHCESAVSQANKRLHYPHSVMQ